MSPPSAVTGDHWPDLGPPPGFSLSDALHDPQYKLFLENIRVINQYSYIFELPAIAGKPPVSVVYEGVGNSPSPGVENSRTTSRNWRCRVKSTPSKMSRRGFESIRHSRFSAKMKDRDYLMFLNCVRMRDDSMVYKGFGKGEVVYEEVRDDGDDVREIPKEDAGGRGDEIEVFEVDGGDQVVVVGDDDGGKGENGVGKNVQNDKVTGDNDGGLSLVVIDEIAGNPSRSMVWNLK